MPLPDYHEITLGQFFNMLEGYYSHLNELQQAEWLRFQFVTYSMLMQNPHVKASSKPKSFQAFIDKPAKSPKPSANIGAQFRKAIGL